MVNYVKNAGMRKKYKMIEKYAKKRGMVNASQAVEKILEEI